MGKHNPTSIAINAHLLSAEAGYRRAGIHGYIYQLLDHLPAADPDLHYTLMVGAGTPPDRAAFRVRRSRWNTDRPTRRILWEQIAQPTQVGGFDLVHEMAFVAPLVMPRPFVVTVYDLTFMRYPERLTRTRRLYLRALTGLSCRRARRVMAISQSTADDLVHLLHIPAEKIDLAIPGVDPRFCPLPPEVVAQWRESKGLPEHFFLFVGTLEPRKNLPTLLRAFAALPEADRRAMPLVLAGGVGWMAESIDRVIADYDLATTVHKVGFVPDSDLVWWYNAADVFVYPSIFEGWGLPITEAMACGKPVIASNVSSLPEAAGDTGLLLPPEDVSAWTAALARGLNDREWKIESGERARQRAVQFTWERTAQQTVQSYYRALQRSL
jgi:glycosyltransferase involved in cell wall biosynthesis